jgi:hypothetical protein
MNFEIFSLLLLQIIFFSIVGFPIAYFLSTVFNQKKELGIIISSPIFGVIITLWYGLLGVCTGISPYWMVRMLLTITSIINIYIIYQYLRSTYSTQKKYNIILSIFVIIVFFAIGVSLFSADYEDITPPSYFPMTNGDTFSYLGQIDQIRSIHALLPQMEYPAGYSPAYMHAINIRSAVTSLIAGQAELLHVDTHIAFFSSIRLTIPLVALGLLSLFIVLEMSYFSSVIGTILFLCGNFMFHQVFQQFLSSSFGVVCAIGIILIGLLAIEKNYNYWVLGGLGFVGGIYCLTSPEAHLFFILGIIIFFSIYLIKTPLKIVSFPYPIKAILCGGFGFFLGVLPRFPSVYIDLFGQYIYATHTHPGDWIAQWGYFVQASGVLPLYKGTSVFSTSILTPTMMVSICALTVFGILFLFVRSIIVPSSDVKKNTKLLFIGTLSATGLIFFTYFFFAHKGYSMLKVFDYHCFIPALIIGIWINEVKNFDCLKNNVLKKYLFCIIIIIFTISFSMIALPNKFNEMNNYYQIVKATPSLNSYELSGFTYDTNSSVRADLYGEPLNMFLYVNRWQTTPLIFYPEESYRYIPNNTSSSRIATHIFRMGHTSYREHEFIDINRPRDPVIPPTAELIPMKNYVRLIHNSSSNWLTMNGNLLPQNQFRWLSREGFFEIYSPSDKGHLNVELAAGPDIGSENLIQVIIDGKVLEEIQPERLPVKLKIQITNESYKNRIECQIKILGPQKGIRQISVAGLFIDT